jgi:hypothetical protein
MTAADIVPWAQVQEGDQALLSGELRRIDALSFDECGDLNVVSYAGEGMPVVAILSAESLTAILRPDHNPESE